MLGLLNVDKGLEFQVSGLFDVPWVTVTLFADGKAIKTVNVTGKKDDHHYRQRDRAG